jgi:hypothetical protein
MYLAVHVVFSLDQLSAVNLAGRCFASHDVAFGLKEQNKIIVRSLIVVYGLWNKIFLEKDLWIMIGK